MKLQIVESTPWYLIVEFDGRRARLAADAAARPDANPDFVVYETSDQQWLDGTAMSKEDQVDILALLPDAARDRGWTISIE